MSGIIWFINAGIICFIVAVGFVVLLPVQVVMWVVQRKPFSRTDPYQYLNYMLYRAWADPGTTTRPYAEWQENKTLPDDLWVSPVLERKRREREEEEARAREEAERQAEDAKAH